MGPVTHDRGPVARNAFPLRSVLAPPRWSFGAPVGVAAVAAASAADAVLGSGAAFVAALAAVLVVTALVFRRGDAIVIGVAAVAATALGALWTDWNAAEQVLALAAVGAVAVSAFLVAHLRATAAVTARQLQILRDLLHLGGRDLGVEGTVDRVLGILVPALGDICSIDLRIDGRPQRVGTRVDGDEPRGEAALLRRRLAPDDAAIGTGRAMSTGRSQRVDPFDTGHLELIAASPEDLEALRALRLRSALYLPLSTRGETVGALSLATSRSGRRYSDDDLRFAEVVAARVAISLDNAGLTRRAAVAERRLIAALEALDQAVTINDADGRTVYVNRAAVRLLRAGSAEELVDAPVGRISERFAIYDEHGAPVGYEQFPAFRALRGDPDPLPFLVRNVVRATGEERWLVNRVSVLRDASGALDRVVNVIEDVTTVKRAELAQRLLAEAARVLSSSLDYEQTLQQVAEVAVPDLADWCGVDLPGRGVAIDPVGIAHGDPDKVRLARELREKYPVRLDDETGLASVILGAPSIHVREVTDEAVVAAAEDEEHLRLLRAVGFASILIVPLVGGDETLGALTLVRSDPVRKFTEDDLHLAEELGRRAGVAVLNARLYGERVNIARELQKGLRPPRLPAIAGLRAATLYRPAGELNEVGGDFYDAFATPRGWMALIGDVEGQGARAASLTALARFTIRTAAELTGDPVVAATHLNRTLGAQPELALCTAVLLLLRADPEAGGLAVTVVSCGHPLPVLLRDGAAEEVGGTGPLAGAFESADWPTTTVALRGGDTLFAYTDGVLDTDGGAERFGDARLRATLREAPSDPAGVVAHVDDALRAFQRGPQRDDTAMVALTIEDAGAVIAAMPAGASTREAI